NGLNNSAIRLHREHQASAHDLAVDAYRAGTAHAMLTTDMRARQVQMLSQEIRQIEPRQDLGVDAFAVDFKRNRHCRSHAAAPASSGWPRRAVMQRVSSTLARCRRIAPEACWSSCGSSSSSSAAAACEINAGVIGVFTSLFAAVAS